MTQGRTGRRPRFATSSTLLPTIVQDDRDGTVLGLAYSNRRSWSRTGPGEDLVLWSRRRRRLWRKGETSGNSARVRSAAIDCDGDALLVRVVPRGPFCHTGLQSCFDDRSAEGRAEGDGILPELERLLKSRRRRAPSGSYTAALLHDEERRLKKVGEEATEVVVAAARSDRAAVVRESADLVYHLLVLLQPLGIRWAEIEETLRTRRVQGARVGGEQEHRPHERRAGRPSDEGERDPETPRTRRV